MKNIIVCSAKVLRHCWCIALVAGAVQGNAATVISWTANASLNNVPTDLTNAIAISAGGSHGLALRGDGTVASWGSMNQSTVPLGLGTVVAIAGAETHSLAVRSDGTVAAWGANDYGKCDVPFGLTGVVAVAGGRHFSLALKRDGTIAAWGINRDETSVPPGLTGVAAIAANGYHSVALRSNGTVVAFGLGDNGALNVPSGLTNVVAISAGAFHSLALKQDGTVVAWGSNGAGESSVPPGLHNVVAVAAGWTHSVALGSDGTVTSWGSESGVPSGLPPMSAVSAGIGYTLGLNAAIVFTRQPVSQSVFVGTTTEFEVTAVGTTPLSYQWRKDGIAIPNATNSALSLTSVATNDTGHYDVVVASALGAATSKAAVLQVLPYGAPSIRMNGQIVVGSFTVAAPEAITVSLTGGFTNGFIFYTLDGTEPNLGSSFYTGPFLLTNSATVVGLSLSADLAETAVCPAVKALIVPRYALLTSAIGSGTISVNPALDSHPSNSVVTLTASPALHFAFDHWEGDITGNANPASLAMNGPRTVRAVFVASEYPLTLTASTGGTVTANGQAIAPETWFPQGSIVSLAATPDSGWGFLRWEGTAMSTNNPLLLTMNQTNVIQGVFGTMVLNASTPGGGRVTVNGQAILPDTHYPPGTVVSVAAIAESGWSFVRWEGTFASTNNPLTLPMTESHTLQAIFGTTVRMAVAGSGNILLNPTNPVPYGAIVTATAVPTAGYSFLAWSGAVSGNMNPTSLTVTNPSPLIGGVFTGPPIPVVVAHPTNLTVVQGQSAEFVVTASGAMPLRFQWRKETNVIAQATNANYVIPSVVTTNAGHYDVVVSNIYGSVTSLVAELTVVVPPSVAVEPVSHVAASGATATLSVVASGTEPLSYQWQNKFGSIPDATNATLVLNPAQTNDAGNYFVVITNRYGVATSAVATITVFIPVSINTPPTQQAVAAGGTATFQVGATGFPPPNYQWLFFGEPLPAATGSSLILTNVGTNALGPYAIAVWNAYSATTSAPVHLVMLPSLRASFRGATVIWGKPTTLSVSAWGTEPLSYQWFKNGTALEWATNAMIDLPAAQINDGGLYSVVISSPWGSVTNPPAQLVVNPANIALGLYAGVTIEGVPGYTYGIQYTTDLRNTNSWITITNLTLSQPVELWVDQSVDVHSPTNARRYYRVTGQ